MNKAVCASMWVAALLGAGCVVQTVPVSSAGIAVTGPPPEPMTETRPPPAPGRDVWIAGYWHWSGMQYTWIPGHWAPRGATWRAPRYFLYDGVYYYEPGTWSGVAR